MNSMLGICVEEEVGVSDGSQLRVSSYFSSDR